MPQKPGHETRAVHCNPCGREVPYAILERLHPWIDYLGAVALLVTGFRLLLHDGQALGVVPLLLGLALAFARVARFKLRPTAQDTERVPQATINDDGSVT